MTHYRTTRPVPPGGLYLPVSDIRPGDRLRFMTPDWRETRTVARIQRPSRLARRPHWVIHFTDGGSTEWPASRGRLSVYPAGVEPQPFHDYGSRETRDAY
jgi:hypothetical protein